MGNMDIDSEAPSAELKVLIQDTVDRCQRLNDEVDVFITAVNANQKFARVAVQNPVEYRSLRNDFKNELIWLNKLGGKKMTEAKARNYIVSSNLLYYTALWDAAKRTTGILAFRKYFFWNRQKEGGRRLGMSLAKANTASNKGKSSALVDIVCADGMEWVRVSTTSEKRLLFDLAKLGWQNGSDSDDDEDDEMPDAPSPDWEDNDDDEDQVGIVKNARELARAAKANPIRGRPPQVHFVLTRIVAGKTKEIDAVLQKIRETGVTVQCENEIPDTPSLEDALPNLLVDRSRLLSHVINIDCTILLALISDISHRQCEILDWYPSEVKAQIEQEKTEMLLPTHLYPTIASHPMVTTQEAAEQMQQIVDTLATDSEKERADLLLAHGNYEGSSPEVLVQVWASMSDHAIPNGFRLPIQMVPGNLEQLIARLPSVASKIAGELSPLNASIFFYGWAEGITTLSSNRIRARQIEHIINQDGLEEGEAGPHIWLCGESRSLVAKHGRRI
ncbi:hypothetical protein K504DRAFT_439634 [Pleomassaria siparia CBS 279.74]|uniref:DUF1308 domain-containing protein n=1 Tax=Pleomassaria siparia CBS 279.74 TaxID=1314801 RepID=A0A6G1JZQ4_9PLEO|nr:hypothetical protein K504DRAFT_439634 [Pleomassaria siparia CBS 279.74]